MNADVSTGFWARHPALQVLASLGLLALVVAALALTAYVATGLVP